jgi:toxin-antitoxin system PIN domain toxin
MRSLLDVSFLIAWVDRSHVSHHIAQAWLAAHRTLRWATCPITENGCLRIITNPKYLHPASAAKVLQALDEGKADSDHEFWPDDLSVTGSEFERSALTGHQQVTDIYLLALAVNRGARLITFDTGISLDAVAGATEENLLVLSTS